MPRELPVVTVPRARIIEFPIIPDARGNLSFIEGGQHVPFDIARVFYLYDVPGGESRAGHAHHAVEQVLIAMAGSFDVIVDDGRTRERIALNRSYYGLHLSSMVWREIDNFSSGSVCLALASLPYAEDDYIRDYDAFVALARGD
jgi:hypothetical protein